jgi:hypothetical protein
MALNVKNNSLLQKDLILYNNALYEVLFSLNHFQRAYRRFYRFSIVSNSFFTMKSKITDRVISIKVLPDNYFLLSYSFHPHTYLFCSATQKKLLEKMIKHNIY